MKHYFLQILIAFDQLLCTFLGGWADESLSSYAWRLKQKNKYWGKIWVPIIDWLFFVSVKETNHCYNAYMAERKRAQLPPEFRN